jgi:non-homologous end joining protein Ku
LIKYLNENIKDNDEVKINSVEEKQEYILDDEEINNLSGDNIEL